MSATTMQTPEPSALWRALAAGERALLLRAAESAIAEGGDAYLVGGPVRGLLRGDVHLHDIDIVTTVDARRVAQRFAAGGEADVTKTTDFGTATIHLRDDVRGIIGLDFATARTEAYPQPGALPAVTFPATIDEDLLRRDLTVNAMALPITTHGFGGLIDPTGGLADLRRGMIRILHDASFRDDPTRLYRAVRYAARFAFIVDPHTAALIRDAVAAGALGTISRDRKRRELELGLLEHDPVACFAAFDAFGLLLATSPALVWDDWVANRLRHAIPRADASPRRAARAQAERFDPMLAPIWASFVARHDDATVDALITDVSPKRMQRLVRRLVRVWRERDFIASAPRLSALRPLLEKLRGPEVLALLDDDPAATRAAAFYAALQRTRRQEIGGHDSTYLMKRGIPQSPVYGEILGALRGARLDGRVRTRQESEEFIETSLRERGLAP